MVWWTAEGGRGWKPGVVGVGGVVYKGFWRGVFECFEMWCGKGWAEGWGFVGVWCFVVEMGAEKCRAMWDGVRWLRYPRV